MIRGMTRSEGAVKGCKTLRSMGGKGRKVFTVRSRIASAGPGDV